MIVSAAYLISGMTISMMLRASKLSMELEADYTCPKQVLAFIKKAQVLRAINIQLSCCNRVHLFYNVAPLGRHSMALRLDCVSLGKYTPKGGGHGPVIRVAGMMLWERKFSMNVIRITFGLSLSSMVQVCRTCLGVLRDSLNAMRMSSARSVGLDTAMQGSVCLFRI